MDECKKDSHQIAEISCKDEIGSSMAQYYNNSEMSDIILKLDGKTYYAHKFVLGLMSDVFRTMCSQRWETEGVGVELELRECEECVPVFEIFLKLMYCGVASVDVNTALPLLMLADKYNVQPLKESFENFMNLKVGEGSVIGALRWMSYAQLSGHVTLQKACFDVVITKMDEVVKTDEFLQLELGFLLALLARDDLVVLWEQTIFEAVTRWIDAQHDLSNGQLQTVLSYIRFPMMLPTQLHAAETSELYIAHNMILAPMFAAAHRFRSIAVEVVSESFTQPNFRPRNYTHKLWCHFVSADMSGDSFCQKSLGVSCLNHPVLNANLPAEPHWQIQISSEKRVRGPSTSHRNTMPTMGYNFTVNPVILDRNVPLTVNVVPLNPLANNIMVDIVMFQVKKERIAKRLCQSSIKFSGLDDQEQDRGESSVKTGNRGMMSNMIQQQQQHQQQNNGTLKFSTSPMHFAFIFQPPSPFQRKNDVTLRYSFSLNELDHPAEVPCFKFNGPSRMTNSVKVAIIFKPRFIIDEAEEEIAESSSAMGSSTDKRDDLPEKVHLEETISSVLNISGE